MGSVQVFDIRLTLPQKTINILDKFKKKKKTYLKAMKRNQKQAEIQEGSCTEGESYLDGFSPKGNSQRHMDSPGRTQAESCGL